ncbi:hypothetical protein GCM10027568_19320 [Humibacter soli]
MTQPAVSAMRTIAMTPSPSWCALRWSLSAANSCDPAAPENDRMTALIRNTIHTWVENAMPSQPTNPARAQSRKRFSRRPVRSERAPTRYPAMGAVRLVK